MIGDALAPRRTARARIEVQSPRPQRIVIRSLNHQIPVNAMLDARARPRAIAGAGVVLQQNVPQHERFPTGLDAAP